MAVSRKSGAEALIKPVTRQCWLEKDRSLASLGMTTKNERTKSDGKKSPILGKKRQGRGTLNVSSYLACTKWPRRFLA
jgi:hypothetical protein